MKFRYVDTAAFIAFLEDLGCSVQAQKIQADDELCTKIIGPKGNGYFYILDSEEQLPEMFVAKYLDKLHIGEFIDGVPFVEYTLNEPEASEVK